MNKSIFLTAALVCILARISFSCDDISSKVIKAAQDNLASSLAKIPAGQEKSFGFTSRDEFVNASVGKPYRVITFHKDFYNDEVTLDKNNSIVTQNEWRVPVTVNGKNRLLLTVTGIGDEYKVVDVGGAGLAKELEQKTIVGNNYFLLRIYPLSADFVAVSNSASLEQAQFIPLTSALSAFEFLKAIDKSSWLLDELLSQIKEEKKRSKN